MQSTRLFTSVLGAARRGAVSNRNLGISAPVLSKASDPIQQLFVDKIREYKQKSAGGKLVDPTPEIQRELAAELDKLSKVYGATSAEDMVQFPAMKFAEPKLDPVNMETS